MPDLNLLGLAGFSDSGKTTLLEKIIPLLVEQGLRIAVIKHAHHDFEIDKPGKDSYRQRKAGASEVLIASAQRWALIHELGHDTEPTLTELCARLSPCDLVLVEGFKHAAIPKLEIHRQACEQPYLHPFDAHIIAIVTDNPDPSLSVTLPVLDINAPQEVATFIMKHIIKS